MRTRSCGWAAVGAGCCRARRRRDHALFRARALCAQPDSHRSDPFVQYSYPLCACFPTLARVISALSSIIRTLTRIVRTLTRTIPTLSAIRSGPASSVPHCRSRQGQFVCLFVSSPLGCVFRPSADAEGRTRGRRFRRRRRRLRLASQVRRCVSAASATDGTGRARARSLRHAHRRRQTLRRRMHLRTPARARKGPVTHPSVHAPTLRCRY